MAEHIEQMEDTDPELEAALQTPAGKLWMNYEARINTLRSINRRVGILNKIDAMRRAMEAANE